VSGKYIEPHKGAIEECAMGNADERYYPILRTEHRRGQVVATEKRKLLHVSNTSIVSNCDKHCITIITKSQAYADVLN